MKEIEGNVPANQGVILKAAMGVSKVTVKVVNTADAIDNDLKGTNDEMTDLSQVYVFGRDNVTRHVGFYTAAGAAALPANRAYLDKPAQEAVNAVAMNFGNGMVTNINTAISAQSTDRAPIYDLSGRACSTPSRVVSTSRADANSWHSNRTYTLKLNTKTT